MIFLTCSTDFNLKINEPSEAGCGVQFIHKTKTTLRDVIAKIRDTSDADLGTVILDVPEELELRIIKHLIPGEEPHATWKSGDPAGAYFAPQVQKKARVYRSFPRGVGLGDTLIICGMAKRAIYMHGQINNVTLDVLTNSANN